MNYHQNNYISRDEEEEAWYDEDTGTVLYGSAKVSWDNNLTIVEYIGNKNGKRTYNFTDNILMCSGMFGVCDMYDILKNMWNRIQGIRYTPMLVSTIAMPDREIGSRIIINDDGKEIKSYVFNKQTNGSTSMMDEIDSTYM